MTLRDAGLCAAFAAAGGATGWAYFAILRCSLACLAGAKPSWRRFGALAGARVGLFAAGLLGAAGLGTWPLVGYLAGFLVARTAMVTAARRTDSGAPQGTAEMNEGA